MSTLDVRELVEACASSSFWRRETAQRLLIERGDVAPVPHLRKLLARETSSPTSTLIITLHTLEALGALSGEDLRPFVSHEAAAVRVHALQLADRRFARGSDPALLDATLLAAAAEKNLRVLLQFALSLGETRDARAFASQAEFARKHAAVRWMDAALLSSLQGRGADMIAELLRETGGGRALLEPLAKSIAARKDEAELARTIALVHPAPLADQAALLGALAKGLGNTSGKTLARRCRCRCSQHRVDLCLNRGVHLEHLRPAAGVAFAG